MSQETNPFRLSMLRRSQSPLEDPFGSDDNDRAPLHLTNPAINVTSATAAGSSHNNPFFTESLPPSSGYHGRVAVSSSSSSNNSNAPRIPPVVVGSDTEGFDNLDPPPYMDSEGRRHSAPSLTNPDDEKSRLAARDDNYREGYEEGMRIARERERQRRREIREQREQQRRREGRSDPGRGHEERRHGSSSREHSSREHSSRDQASRERSRRSRSKSESAGGSSRSHRNPRIKNASLDVIDKMDVTGFYGGSGFHHDGPFDACAPHRNKTGIRGATPISAFPADGPNNSLAVEDSSLSAYRKEEAVYGRQVDSAPEVAQASFDPTERGAKVHGQRSLGLGSTTFIDGTPASRDAIAQAGRERSESLGRSRSLLRRQPSVGRRYHDDADHEEDEPKTLLGRVRSLRVGRH